MQKFKMAILRRIARLKIYQMLLIELAVGTSIFAPVAALAAAVGASWFVAIFGATLAGSVSVVAALKLIQGAEWAYRNLPVAERLKLRLEAHQEEV